MERFGHEIFDRHSYENSMKRAIRLNRGFAPYQLVIALSDEQADVLADFADLRGEDRQDEVKLCEAVKTIIEALAEKEA